MARQSRFTHSSLVVDGGRENNSPDNTRDPRETGDEALWGWDSNGVLWTRDDLSQRELLEPIVALAGEEGLSREKIVQHTAFHPAVYTRVFGSWTAALESADVLDGDVEGLLDEVILDGLHTESERLGRPPTPSDISESAVEEVLARFGTWNNALFEARVELVSASELTEDEQFLLYKHEVGDYTTGFGEFGYLSGWGEHHSILEFLEHQGEKQFTTDEFATVIEGGSERAEEMLEFVESLGFARRDDKGWVVRVEDQENVAGWLRRGKSLE
jgi:hypothetical protein